MQRWLTFGLIGLALVVITATHMSGQCSGNFVVHESMPDSFTLTLLKSYVDDDGLLQKIDAVNQTMSSGQIVAFTQDFSGDSNGLYGVAVLVDGSCTSSSTTFPAFNAPSTYRSSS